MKKVILYSSKTGNTKKIAEAMYSETEDCDLFSIDEISTDDVMKNYDLIFIGSWIHRGTVSPQAVRFIKNITGKSVAYFGTLGAYPDSKHGVKTKENIERLLESNTVLGGFLSQGAVDPEYLKKYGTKDYSSTKHPMTEERRERLKVAALHPDVDDCNNAKMFYMKVLKNEKDAIR